MFFYDYSKKQLFNGSIEGTTKFLIRIKLAAGDEIKIPKQDFLKFPTADTDKQIKIMTLGMQIEDKMEEIKRLESELEEINHD
jgi:hypothetical protein